MLTINEKKTIEYYDKHAKEWIKARGSLSDTFLRYEIKKFNSLLPSGKIIEIGSGSGREASRLISLGYDYIGTDVSKSLLSYARKNNPNAKFLLKSIYELDFFPNTFDGFWTSATLLHIPKSKINKALKCIKRIVKYDGVGFISMKEGKGEPEGVKDSVGRFFTYHELNEFIKILEDADMQIIEANRRTQTRKDGEKVKWLTFFVRTT